MVDSACVKYVKVTVQVDGDGAHIASVGVEAAVNQNVAGMEIKTTYAMNAFRRKHNGSVTARTLPHCCHV